MNRWDRMERREKTTDVCLFPLRSSLIVNVLADEPLQVLQSEFDALELIFHTLKFYGYKSVITDSLQSLDTLVYLCLAVTDDGATEVRSEERR